MKNFYNRSVFILFFMNVVWRFVFAVAIIVLSALYIFPWKNVGITIDNEFLNKQYTLGLDLQGGVELDYQVDLSALKTDENNDSANHPNSAPANNESVVVEGLKKIIDTRVSSLGLSEPNIQTLKYGTDTHIVVQIHTESYSDLSPEEREKRQQQDIKNAKEVIGKVVDLEFRELRTSTSDEEYAAREKLASEASEDLKTLDFNIISQKYHKPNDNIVAKTGTGEIPPEAKISALEKFSADTFPHIFDAEEVVEKIVIGSGAEAQTNVGYVALRLDQKISENNYKYSYVRVNREPGMWAPAKSVDGKILNDNYLTSASAFLDSASFQPKVSLTFNDEGAKIFAEITKRLIGQPLAIFVGDEMVMNARVNDTISNGRAEISGGYATLAEAKAVADDITTGIVPAPIYLTSERTIDAKIGDAALEQIMLAGVVGLSVIVLFLTIIYRVGGLLAGIALVSYAVILIAIVKMTGVTLTLASIAGVILSIGLAIDANILIFERVHEALHEKMPLNKAISIGFKHSWAAIWDSHITSFLSAFILFAVGVSLIKGFGFMLGVGILLSLFTAMWISRALIAFTAKFVKNPKILVGYKK